MLKAFPDTFLKKSRIFLYAVFLFALFPLLLLLAPPAAAQRAGALDTTFSDDGVAGASFTSPYTFGRAPGGIAVQPDNKVVIAGYVQRPVNSEVTAYEFAVARFNADGSLDQTFGTGGKVTTLFPNFISSPEARAVVVQPDGKIVVGGWAYDDFTLVRYNANGSLDNSFNGTGIVHTGFEDPFSSFDAVEDLVLQPDGKIVAVGFADSFVPPSNTRRRDFAVVRYNPDGSLDTTFNGSGKLKLTFGNGFSWARSVVLRPDGKIVVSGWTQTHALGVARLNADGSLDFTFGAGGKALISVPSRQIYPYKAALQPDNKIIVAFQAYDPVDVYPFSLIRVNDDGTLDQSFDGDGVADAYFDNGGVGIAFDVAVQPDGKIIAAGYSYVVQNNVNFTVARFNPNGSLDFTFGTGGITISDLFGSAYANSVALAPDGKIVVGGDGSLGNFIVARYHAVSLTPPPADFDYDGDGKADISVFRPSVGDWYFSRSSAGGEFFGTHFGAAGDLIAPADFDGDGKTDISLFRPSVGSWYRLNSSNNSFVEVQYGAGGDLPVPGDFDGDGRADISIYRPSAGSWYRLNSSNNQSVGAQFGIAEDKPLVGDFDGDGKSDLTVFRPSNGTWYRINSATDTFSPNQFGATGDLPVAADYDGDGKTDLAVYRPSVGDWYIINSSNSSFTGLRFGISEDKPAPADFDGDGKADLVVWRPSKGTWYLLRTTAGFTGFQFGANGDIPTPNAFVR